MTPTEQPDAGHGFQGRDGFRTALLQQTAAAAAMPRSPVVHDLIWVDEDFRDWPLDDSQLIANLTVFLRHPGRRLRLIAQQWTGAESRHPRFARWRRDWSHVVDAQVGTEPLGLHPMALGAGLVVEVLDVTFWRGHSRSDVAARGAARVQIENWLASCEPGWPATTLGL